MSDFADQASEIQEEAFRIAMLSRKAPERPEATGYCLNPLCANDLEREGQLYCNGQCAVEHERRGGR